MNRELDLNNVKIYSNTESDIIDAMDLIGKEVYMSNFRDFYSYDICNLAGVIGVKHIESDSCHFLAEEDSGIGLHKYRYIILAKDIKFKDEQKLRPFKTVQEFIEGIECEIGDVITYKRKDSEVEYTVLFNGYVRIKDNVEGVYLGRRSYTFKELKDDYLYLHINEWRQFGIEG